MNRRTGRVAGRLAAIGLPLFLSLILVFVWGAGAQDPDPGTDGRPVQYGISVTEEASSWMVVLPEGFEYVGLAAGTQITEEPSVSQERRVLVWDGTFTAAQEIRFWLAPLVPTVAPDILSLDGSDITAQQVEPLEFGTGQAVPEAASPLQAGSLSASKAVEPQEISTGDSLWVTYEVVLGNTGAGPVLLDRVVDTLPTGFLFGGMGPESDLGEPSDESEPEIVWEDVVVPGGSSVRVQYYARAVETPGVYANAVEAIASGETVAEASAPLTVSSRTVFLPLALRNDRPPSNGLPLPFVEDFTYSSLEGWQPFLNWPGLSADRWYWAGQEGVWGIYNYDYSRVEPDWTGYDLSIYNAEGAQEWTDYRIEARINDVKEENQLRGLTGIWFRGTYQNSGAMDGKTVGGYYVYIKPGDDNLYLMRTPTSNPTFGSQQVVDSYAYGPRIGNKHWYDVVIEVEGFHIQVWFGDEENGLVQAFNWTDPTQSWPSGTVGLAAYFTASRFDYIHVLPLD